MRAHANCLENFQTTNSRKLEIQQRHRGQVAHIARSMFAAREQIIQGLHAIVSDNNFVSKIVFFQGR